MVEITLTLKVDADKIGDAEDWLEELANNELFTYNVVNIKKV